MSRTRAGRKAQETHRNFLRNVENFAVALAAKEWKFDSATTKRMVIIKTKRGADFGEVISFSQAYGEISARMNRSFTNISENGLSDMLCESFLQDAQINTPDAKYTLWDKQSVLLPDICDECGEPCESGEGGAHECVLEDDLRYEEMELAA